jgi:hypothetical protein
MCCCDLSWAIELREGPPDVTWSRRDRRHWCFAIAELGTYAAFKLAMRSGQKVTRSREVAVPLTAVPYRGWIASASCDGPGRVRREYEAIAVNRQSRGAHQRR